MNVIIELIELQWLDMVLYRLQCFYVLLQLGRVSCQADGTLFPSVGQLNVVAELRNDSLPETNTSDLKADAESQKERIAFQVENEKKLIIDKGMLLL